MRFQNTVLVSSVSSFKGIKVGQWFQTEVGSRGQYLGTTDAGVAVVRWQNESFQRRDAVNNKHFRRFAKTYGSI